MADRVVIESYEEAVAWLRIAKDSGSWQIAPAARDILAVLEREHEEAERLRNSILNDMAAVLCDPDGNVCIRGSDGDRTVLQYVIDAARKGVSDE